MRRDREQAATYASAIYELALEAWLSSLKAVEDALSRDTALIASLKDRTLELAQKEEMVGRVLPDGASEEAHCNTQW